MIVAELLVDLALVPAEVLEVLDPLEVGDDDAAGVGHHVGDRRGRPCRRGSRRPSAWSGSSRPRRTMRRVERVGVAGVDHAAERGGDEDLALEREQLLGRDRLDAVAVELGQLAARAHVRLQRLGVEPVLGVDRAVRVGDADHRAAELGDDARRPRADVAEALDDDAASRGLRGRAPAPPRGTCRRRRGRSPPRGRRSPRARSACRSRSPACGRGACRTRPSSRPSPGRWC